ncbi:MAG: methionine--tRNA ligase [Thermodesulfobacteriota bacterium]
MADRKFYVTTPIYYVNDIPHIGHAYTTIATDVIARYRRLKGDNLLFLTGTDEHGQKVEKSASGMGLKPIELADRVVERFKSLWEKLNISNDDFIRTTEKRHEEAVHHLWRVVKKKGDIYLGSYEDWYCTPCETFWTEKQLAEGKCPDCGREVERLQEPSYFFRMSKYQERLLRHIEENPDFIQPESRRNEIVSFVREGLRDLSISRTTFSWGVHVPDDPEHVIYVWFDALTNYLTAAGYPGEMPYWPADIHIIGKDILRFHAVYWPTFLMSAGLPLPRRIFAHGWWTVEGQKMSKSVGNVVDPNEMVDRFGLDRFRYFLMTGVPFGQDGDFSLNTFIARVNSDLADDLGNLLSRTLAMIDKYCGGGIPPVPEDAWSEGGAVDTSREKALRKLIEEGTGDDFDASMDKLNFSHALARVWDIIDDANRSIEETAPWALWKEGKRKKLAVTLYTLAESLRIVAVYLSPFIPHSAREIWRQLGIEGEIADTTLDEAVQWGGLKEGTKIARGKPLFPKVEAGV